MRHIPFPASFVCLTTDLSLPASPSPREIAALLSLSPEPEGDFIVVGQINFVGQIDLSWKFPTTMKLVLGFYHFGSHVTVLAVLTAFFIWFLQSCPGLDPGQTNHTNQCDGDSLACW